MVDNCLISHVSLGLTTTPQHNGASTARVGALTLHHPGCGVTRVGPVRWRACALLNRNTGTTQKSLQDPHDSQRGCGASNDHDPLATPRATTQEPIRRFHDPYHEHPCCYVQDHQVLISPLPEDTESNRSGWNDT